MTDTKEVARLEITESNKKFVLINAEVTDGEVDNCEMQIAENNEAMNFWATIRVTYRADMSEQDVIANFRKVIAAVDLDHLG